MGKVLWKRKLVLEPTNLNKCVTPLGVEVRKTQNQE